MHTDLTPKQNNVLNYLRKEIKRRGRAPSLREAAEDLGVSHTAVAQITNVLQSKGFLRRDGRYGRTIHLLAPDLKKATTEEHWRQVPVIGKIAAGLPLYAQQHKKWGQAIEISHKKWGHKKWGHTRSGVRQLKYHIFSFCPW
jgi:repressor LexA